MSLKRVQSQIKAHLSLRFLCQRRKNIAHRGPGAAVMWERDHRVSTDLRTPAVRTRAPLTRKLCLPAGLTLGVPSGAAGYGGGWRGCRVSRGLRSPRCLGSSHSSCEPRQVIWRWVKRVLLARSHSRGPWPRHLLPWILCLPFPHMGHIIPSSWDYQKSRRLPGGRLAW